MKIFNISRFIFLVPLLIYVQACSLIGREGTSTPPVLTVELDATGIPFAPSMTPQMNYELRPADSDTPAAGICMHPEEETVEVLLGTGPDGLPLGGRCLQITPDQRLKLVNRMQEEYSLVLGPYEIALSPGEELLLDRPAGEFLEPGVHNLLEAPEIWLVEP